MLFLPIYVTDTEQLDMISAWTDRVSASRSLPAIHSLHRFSAAIVLVWLLTLTRSPRQLSKSRTTLSGCRALTTSFSGWDLTMLAPHALSAKIQYETRDMLKLRERSSPIFQAVL